MNEQQHDAVGSTGARRTRWNTDPTLDHPIGPDDAGNVVMHGIGLLVNSWRWLVGKLRRQHGAA